MLFRSLLLRLGAQAPQGSRLHPGGAKSPSHRLGPASLPPSPAPARQGQGSQRTQLSLEPSAGLARAQGTPTTDSPEARTTVGPGGRARFSEDTHRRCRMPHSLRLARAGGLCKQTWAPAPPPGGAKPLHPASCGGVGCLQGCGVPPRAEASAAIVLSREEKGQQKSPRLGKAPTPGPRTALPDRAVQPGARAEPSQAGRSVTQATQRCPSGGGGGATPLPVGASPPRSGHTSREIGRAHV